VRYFSTAVVISVLTIIGLWAQSTSVSQISGTVQDSTGSAIAGAQVCVTQTDTGLVLTAASGTDGSYVLTNLPIGPLWFANNLSARNSLTFRAVETKNRGRLRGEICAQHQGLLPGSRDLLRRGIVADSH
jgi:hypothetical protein